MRPPSKNYMLAAATFAEEKFMMKFHRLHFSPERLSQLFPGPPGKSNCDDFEFFKDT